MSGEKKCLVALVSVTEMRAMFSEEMAKQGDAKVKPRPAPAGAGTGHERGGRHQRGQRRANPAPRNTLMPQWKGFQLIGDSMMSRVAQRVARAKPAFNHQLKAKQIGFIVHGQTVGQLLRLLKDYRRPKLGNKILLTIGTNNILKNVPVSTTVASLEKVLELLCFDGQKTVVTTVPPIPKIEGCAEQTSRWEQLNTAIKAIPATQSLTVVDITPHFMDSDSIRADLFESDKLHFSHQGVATFIAAVKDAVQT